jgi:hypothetical protein
MESVPLGSDPDRREQNQWLSLYDVPAYVRRARSVEDALEGLVARGKQQREAWLAMARLRLGRLRALAGDWPALLPYLADEGQLAVLERLWSELAPKLRLPPAPTSAPRRLRRALAELVSSLERFNARWREHLGKVDLAQVNQLREGYNRYYVLEKACALRSDLLARLGFTPLPPLDHAEVERRLPPLPVPRLAR